MVALSENKLKASVDEHNFQINDTIDYKSAIGVASMGQVKEFKYAGHRQCDTSSVWMLIADKEDNSTEWVSLIVWKAQYDAGVFGKKKTVLTETETTITTTANDNKEPEADTEYPF